MKSRQLEGRVTCAENCLPIGGGVVIARDLKGKKIAETVTDSFGLWALEIFSDVQDVFFIKHGYVSKSTEPQKSCSVRLLEDKVVGFQSKLWFEPGEEVVLYAHSPHLFRVKLLRYGLERICLCDFGIVSPICQQVPDGKFVKDGLQWKEAFRYQIPTDARPGIFGLLLEAESGEDFIVPMVVSTPTKKQGENANIIVLASTNTWQTYNLWGGRSRYRNFEDGISAHFIASPEIGREKLTSAARKILPKTARKAIRKIIGLKDAPVDWMHHELSIRRPFNNCGLRESSPYVPFTNHLAGGEWRLLAWLEREGFSYDIVSGFELDQDPELLKNYRGLILSTHSEYWSQRMYDGVQKAHAENGLWLVNLSGNSMFREVDFKADGSLNCKSLSFEKSVADESQLLGVRFSFADYGSCAAYKIVKPDHWVFNRVPVYKSSSYFGFASLNQNTLKDTAGYDPGRPGIEFGLRGGGASGWETDKLTKTASEEFTVVAKGQNPGGGADMVIREPSAKRGGVFSASSITYSGSLLIDSGVSQVTKNVLQRILSGGSESV